MRDLFADVISTLLGIGVGVWLIRPQIALYRNRWRQAVHTLRLTEDQARDAEQAVQVLEGDLALERDRAAKYQQALMRLAGQLEEAHAQQQARDELLRARREILSSQRVVELAEERTVREEIGREQIRGRYQRPIRRPRSKR